MSVVGSKFLPMSLDDIVSAIDELRAAVEELQNSSGSDNDSSLAEKVEALEEAVLDLQNSSGSNDESDLQSQIDDIKDSVNTIGELEARIDALENPDNDPSSRIDELESLKEG